LPLEEAPSEVSEVISVETARTMMQFLQAVVQHGTAASASQLKHPLGGKTGTTNDYTDAWFIGFSPSVTCGTWIGYDDRESLGEKETGARAALPMWMDFMRVADAKKPNEAFAVAGAPQKKLDVPLTPPGAAAKPAAKPEEEDPDAPAAPSGGAPQQAAPSANPGPNAPTQAAPPVTDKPASPAGPHVAAPTKPASGEPAKGTTTPEKPADDGRNGVSKPPPDTN
jgi:penicillin-binding protein 1A